MNIRFSTLTLQCKHSKEVIQFSPQISFFHGQISAGKSSIVRLINFCLGGSLENTPAIASELVSVELATHINEYEVLFEREAQKSNQVQVSWKNNTDVNASVLAPLQETGQPIWGSNIYNLSDLIFYFLNLTPLKVHKSKIDSQSLLIRLSFRDIMWYCYLDQDNLDSSFYRMEDPFRKLKSRDVMRFVMGYYNEHLNNLEIRLAEIQQQLLGKREAIVQIKEFLKQLNYASESELFIQRDSVIGQLALARSEQLMLREEYTIETHFADELREQLRHLSQQLHDEKQALIDLEERMKEERALKAELVSAKFKLAQVESASSILYGVFFECCPACRTPTNAPSYSDNLCYLCGRYPHPVDNQSINQSEIVRLDLISRINELDESIIRHRKSFDLQEHIVYRIQQEKTRLDIQLTEELRYYDSNFLARFRELERRIATYEERLRGLEQIIEITRTIYEMERAIAELRVEEEQLERQIQEEKGSLNNAEQNITSLENNFLEALLAVGVPGVADNYEVNINRKTWIPYILPAGDAAIKWSFDNAGSGGKKSLFKVCYALALHKTALDNNLPLPNFLIIDTPMKNIGEDVNQNIFTSFYNYLYNLAENPLSTTQFIIIDKEYFPPTSHNIDIINRFMTPTDEQAPPLIRYYRGA
ncbi:MAG: AAA family ATPase [Aphanothece sp. CMT-3BRIN-NPC111]|nr:AAA family ATPase [Aphanothece sp. CMT-3BRIN-NPC111]